MNYYLPSGYKIRLRNKNFLDEPSKLLYQPLVYRLAIYIARRAGIKTIIDIGCGSGLKLAEVSNEFQIIGIDSSEVKPLFLEIVPGAGWIECDLNKSMPELSKEMLDSSVVICADVIEHLANPDRLAQYLSYVSKNAPFVLISTPDRDRVRGWLHNGPPDNPCHSMEWGQSEFLRYLRYSGFSERILYGHTINTDFHRVNSTLLVIAGVHAYPHGDHIKKRVAAVIHCFNEADIITEVVNHLIKQGVEIYLYDNWSTDGSWDIAISLYKAGLIRHLERFPNIPTKEYLWAQQLKHTQKVSRKIDADWIIHYDADELRYSPWPDVSLSEGISWVSSLGYNAVDFTVIDFRYMRENVATNSPFESNLNHFQFGQREGHFIQIKAWANCHNVNLVDSGGHEAKFDARKIYPFKFLTKHYPLRSISQASKKIFNDRLPRAKREQAERGWHIQYKHFSKEDVKTGWPRHELIPWSEIIFMTEYLVPRISGIGLQD